MKMRRGEALRADCDDLANNCAVVFFDECVRGVEAQAVR